jgi:DnaJ-class molecular chaperone
MATLRIEPREVRFVTCEACAGGGWVDCVANEVGNLASKVQRRCRVCDGQGVELVEVAPVTLEDLEEAHGGDHQ